jgi:hypothetical protein
MLMILPALINAENSCTYIYPVTIVAQCLKNEAARTRE